MTDEAIGFVGTGDIARAIVRGVAPAGRTVVVSRRSEAVSAALAAEMPNVSVAEAQTVLDQCDTVFLCLRPEIAGEALANLQFRPSHRVISVMARVSRRRIAELASPARDIVRMLPMPSVAEALCPLPVYPDRPWIAEVMGSSHSIIPLAREEDLSAFFAASTLASAVADILDTGASWLATRLAAHEEAEQYLAELVIGMLAHHAAAAHRFADLRDSLATAGTLNEEMVAVLRGLRVDQEIAAILGKLAERA